MALSLIEVTNLRIEALRLDIAKHKHGSSWLTPHEIDRRVDEAEEKVTNMVALKEKLEKLEADKE